MAKKRETAGRTRADARQNRKKQADEPADTTPQQNGDSEELLDGLKQAAKVAVASAAVGAAAAAARALADRREQKGGAEPDDSDDAQPLPEAQQEEPEPLEQRENPQPQDLGEEPRREERPEPPRRREPVSGASSDEARDVVEQARQQLEDLLARPAESVSSLERTGDGWLATVEVVEVSRVPESTDVLASYEIDLDDDRNLRRYARVRRYHRSQADGGDRV